MQKAPPEAELSLQDKAWSGDQRPKNSHSRMITGIGTPNIHNKIPRPIASSSNCIVGERTPQVRAGSRKKALPMADVRHRRPRLLRRLRVALLQDLDRVQIRRADEGHVAVARRTVDGNAGVHQLLASGVDVVDLIGEMAEEAVLTIFFLVPIPGELDQRRTASLRLLLQRLEIVRRAQEHQRETPL